MPDAISCPSISVISQHQAGTIQSLVVDMSISTVMSNNESNLRFGSQAKVSNTLNLNRNVLESCLTTLHQHPTSFAATLACAISIEKWQL